MTYFTTLQILQKNEIPQKALYKNNSCADKNAALYTSVSMQVPFFPFPFPNKTVKMQPVTVYVYVNIFFP